MGAATVVLLLLSIATAIDFFAVVARARQEWARSDELSRATALMISSLYALSVALLAVAVIARPWAIDASLAIALGVAAPLAAIGAVFAVLGARPFGSTSHLYGVERGGLIEGGIYDLSRNPQYVGLALVVLAVAVGARSGAGLAFAAFFAAAMWVWVVVVEEPHLERAFGPRYAHYRREVPRALGLGKRG